MATEATVREFRPANPKTAHSRKPYQEIRRMELNRAKKEKRDPKLPVVPELEDTYAEIWNNTTSLARIIRDRREELMLPQVFVAQHLGIRSSEFISMVENGQRNLELNKIPKLAEILKLDVKSLCRVALFESAPQFAFSLLGASGKNFVPANARNKAPQEVMMTEEQIVYNAKLYSLPSTLRLTVLNLIDQFVALVKRGTARRIPSDTADRISKGNI